MDKSEQQWVTGYRQGDIEALGRLVEHYRRPLYAFILRMTEGSAEADEIFQEVWFRAIRKFDRYRDKSFLSWLFRIAHNLVIDRARKARPVVDIQGRTTDGEDVIEATIPDRRVGPDHTAAGHDLGVRIAAAVERLPAEQREVFLLRTEAGMPFKAIARIQKTSINTALGRMHYALAKLKDELKDEYEALMRN